MKFSIFKKKWKTSFFFNRILNKKTGLKPVWKKNWFSSKNWFFWQTGSKLVLNHIQTSCT